MLLIYWIVKGKWRRVLVVGGIVLVIGAVGSALEHDDSGASRRPDGCAPALYFSRTLVAADSSAADVMSTANAGESASSYRTALAYVGTMEAGLATTVPTMAVDMWGAYDQLLSVVEEKYRAAVEGVARTPVDVDTLLAKQNGPVATFNAECYLTPPGTP